MVDSEGYVKNVLQLRSMGPTGLGWRASRASLRVTWRKWWCKWTNTRWGLSSVCRLTAAQILDTSVSISSSWSDSRIGSWPTHSDAAALAKASASRPVMMATVLAPNGYSCGSFSKRVYRMASVGRWYVGSSGARDKGSASEVRLKVGSEGVSCTELRLALIPPVGLGEVGCWGTGSSSPLKVGTDVGLGRSPLNWPLEAVPCTFVACWRQPRFRPPRGPCLAARRTSEMHFGSGTDSRPIPSVKPK
mmetsp:Transcript_76055/g.134296  ORF Transcript_76055/g.134296 Transcript_76055/m.134296 type:complete len:247 (+) Transcript_76055:1067-1807(+)